MEKIDRSVLNFEEVDVSHNLFRNGYRLIRIKGCAILDLAIEKMTEIPNFCFRKEDVIVSSFPKSGTTWMQEIVYMLINNFEASNNESVTLDLRFPYLEYNYPDLNTFEEMPNPRCIKTHLPFHLLPDNFTSSGAKLIYIQRDARDTVVSYFHFAKFMTVFGFTGSFKEFVELFMQDKISMCPYFDHINGYHERRGNANILIVTYEDLKAEPIKMINSVANFLEIPVTQKEAEKIAAATTFDSMSQNQSVNYEHFIESGDLDPSKGKFMRKGEIGDWKNHFDPELLQKFTEWENRNCNRL